MNKNDSDDILEDWVQDQRQQTVPMLSPDFSARTLSRIEAQPETGTPPTLSILARIAALLVIGAVGFLRLHCILILILTFI